MTNERLDEPFDQLRLSDAAISPPPRFSASLRARLVAALDAASLPLIQIPEPERSAIMTTDLTTNDLSTHEVSDEAVSRPGLTPYICATPAADAIDWYVGALGAVEFERYVGDDGRIGHARVRINGSDMYISDEYPEVGAVSPVTLGGSPVALHLSVPDVDAVYAAAVAAGATGERAPTDEPYGDRASSIIDPFGHRWMIHTTIDQPSVEEINASMTGYTMVQTSDASRAAMAPVELGYFTLSAPDTARAARFFGALFGWTIEQGSMGGDYAHVNNTTLPLGFAPGAAADAPELYFRVEDLAASAARVRELGGQVITEAESESGRMADCRDDQDRHFQLWQPAPGY